ncbi:hypothetical protein E1292_17440 [Nonomuraea deserti]|uniref:Uncharacterized protein n=1 Tax=Nonomuraea deserti TaxID=1848322 RepID=A0A4R4VRL8_9ACTN|nr:hypothetical protein [Nonomuraea deserti]TDD05244.1 hypothetical protein E1292_17440 [Nonomuraea deserti]
MSKHRPDRTHPVGYFEAVVDDLTTLGIKTIQSGATKVFLSCPGAESTLLAWDDEFGWTIEVTEDTNHGYTHLRYGLPLHLNAEPAEVALTVGITIFESDGSDLEFPRRKTAKPNITPCP